MQLVLYVGKSNSVPPVGAAGLLFLDVRAFRNLSHHVKNCSSLLVELD